MRVRGLKFNDPEGIVNAIVSHPMRVRGLKSHDDAPDSLSLCRTPCGCVD